MGLYRTVAGGKWTGMICKRKDSDAGVCGRREKFLYRQRVQGDWKVRRMGGLCAVSWGGDHLSQGLC